MPCHTYYIYGTLKSKEVKKGEVLKSSLRAGLILDTNCVRYPHVVPYFCFSLPFSHSKNFKLSCFLGGWGVPSS